MESTAYTVVYYTWYCSKNTKDDCITDSKSIN